MIRKNEKLEALHIFDYYTRYIKDANLKNASKDRVVGEVRAKCQFIEEEIIGFQNRSSVMINVKEDSLFKVLKGTGYKPDEIIEGIHYNNFYGTYLLGPILVRNPYFTDYLVNEICKDLNVKFKANTGGMAYRAYHEYIKNFHGEQ